MEDPAVWFNPTDVRSALARLGLTLDPFQEAAQAGFLARASRTANDAPNAPGTYQWNETLRVIREHLVSMHWMRSNLNGLPTVVNPDRTIAVSVSSGNEFTGNPVRTPSTKYDKGPSTKGFVASNATQTELFPAYAISDEEVVILQSSTIATWTFLFVTDADNDEVRSELSLPVYIDDGGRINRWKERIILPVFRTDDGGGSGKYTEPDFGPDIDVDIRRRA